MTNLSVLAILISCLGLWGLVGFVSQQRTKEIGIRKIVGASVTTILLLLSKEFIVMVLIALCVALLLTYYFMYDWLQAFAFRIDMGWGTFVLAAVLLITLALITIGINTLRAARANPVKSLRSE